MAFEKKTVSAKTKWSKKEFKKEKRALFQREYTRDVKFGSGDTVTYVWVFTEYKKPDPMAPQFRLREEKFVMDGRTRCPVPPCQVAWEVEMSVRREAYSDFCVHIGR